jgi:hypothetical protein
MEIDVREDGVKNNIIGLYQVFWDFYRNRT